MSTRKDEEARIALLQGTLDLLILRTLQGGPEHGQGIARAIQQQSADTFLVDHSSLYPALQRLEARGWIRADWGDIHEQPQGTLLRVDEIWPQTARG